MGGIGVPGAVHRPAVRRATTVAVSLLLLAGGGCGLGGSDSSGADAAVFISSVPSIPADPGEGCGDAAVTDPEDLRPGRPVARCAPGFPEPDPLADGRDVTVALAGGAREAHAPLLLAREFGEFEAENLTVEVVETEDLGSAYDALADGDADVVVGDLHATFFDHVAAGGGGRLVLGGWVPSEAGATSIGQAGYWVRADAVEGGDWETLQGAPVAVPEGISSATAHPMDVVMMQGDLSLNDVRIERTGGPEAAGMLADGEVDAAWLEDPYWQEVAARGEDFWLAATRPQENLGGVVVSGDLVAGGDREVGAAFIRAMIRTINTYLGSQYREDREVVDVLLDSTGWSSDELHGTPPLIFDWELRDGNINQIQRPLVRLGAVLYPEPLPPEDIVDRGLYQDAVGAAHDG